MDTPAEHDINLARLPRALRELVECIGFADAMRLVEQRGGTWVCVPRAVSPDHVLADCLSPRAFARLVEWYAGCTVDLPRYTSVVRQMRHREIVEMRSRGAQIDTIALRTGYTARRVWQILAASAADGIPAPEQIDFDF